MENLEEQLREEIIDDWDGLERRHACQGCSDVYSKLIKSEKYNLRTHKDLYTQNYSKISKKSFYVAIILIAFFFVLSHKFRSDFEIRYIKSLETANSKLQSVVYNLKDLITSINSINQRLAYSEEDIDKKIEKIQNEIQDTQKTLDDLQLKVNSKRSK